MTLFGTFNYRAADNKNDLIVDPNPGVVMQVGRKLLQVNLLSLIEEQRIKFGQLSCKVYIGYN